MMILPKKQFERFMRFQVYSLSCFCIFIILKHWRIASQNVILIFLHYFPKRKVGGKYIQWYILIFQFSFYYDSNRKLFMKLFEFINHVVIKIHHSHLYNWHQDFLTCNKVNSNVSIFLAFYFFLKVPVHKKKL